MSNPRNLLLDGLGPFWAFNASPMYDRPVDLVFLIGYRGEESSGFSTSGRSPGKFRLLSK